MAAADDPVTAEPGTYLEPEPATHDDSIYERVLDRAAADDGLYLPHHDMTIDPHTYLVQIVDIHFDEVFGTPYWQEQHAELRDTYGPDFDIREEVREDGMGAIRDYLGEADEDVLRSSEWQIADFYPDLYSPGDIDESKSSASFGDRKKVMPFGKDVSAAVADWFDWAVQENGGGTGNWLVGGPYGVFETHHRDLADARDEHMFFSGIETRGLKKQMQAREELADALPYPPEELWERKAEVMRDPQALYEVATAIKEVDTATVRDAVQGMIRTRPTIDSMADDLTTNQVANISTTPGIAEAVYPVLESDDALSDAADIETVVVGGMQVSAEDIDRLESKYSNAAVIPMYGSSFAGPSLDVSGTDRPTYYPMAPAVRLDVVDPETGEPVAEGGRGQVVLDRLGPDFFWPNQYERESAERAPPAAAIDWNGIADIAPYDG